MVPKVVTIHDEAYQYYSWHQLGDDIFSLAQKLLKSDQEFDRVIALAKGGVTFARSLLDFLNVPNYSSIQIEFYTGINQTATTPVITQSLPTSIQGERVLVFDDLVDSGETMKLAKEYFGYHGAKTVTTATLLRKTWTKFPVDFCVRESNAWVIFPNETRETIQLLCGKWKKEGDSDEKIAEQLRHIGFSQPHVDLFAFAR